MLCIIYGCQIQWDVGGSSSHVQDMGEKSTVHQCCFAEVPSVVRGVFEYNIKHAK